MKRGPKLKDGVRRNRWGQMFCPHNKMKHQCVDCDGANICEHKRRSAFCRDCKKLGIGGSSICEHDKRKDRCVECGGSQLCEHGIDKYGCKKCKGAGVCEHNRERRRCSICNPSGAYKKARDGAIEKGLLFYLTEDEFIVLVSQSCYFCGDSSSPRGVDRFDNDVEYRVDNCVSSCWPCNSSKKEKHGLDFIQLC